MLLGRHIKNAGWYAMSLSEDDDFMQGYGLLLAVADGVGGEAGGAVASRFGLGAFDVQFYGLEKRGDSPLETVRESLLAAGERANKTILSLAANRSDLTGMGCTLAGVALMGRSWLFYCAGDSRVYRMRDGALKQLTRDDTLINIAIEAGRITQEEAERSSVRHTITNCLGTSSFKLAVEQGPELEPGDTLLISSDGLHDMVPYSDLETVMAAGGDSRAKALMLRDRALAAGGRDNIAIIVAQLVCDAAEEVSDATMIRSPDKMGG